MSLSHLFNLIALLYALIAVGVARRLWLARATAFDDELTADDRRLVGAAAFYLAVPLAVALHELGHAAATWAFGGRIADFGYAAYWGYVVPAREPPLAPWQDAVIALAGNAVSLLLGLGAVAWTVLRPMNAARNLLRLEFARVQLGLTLVFYPVMSVLMRFGDFWIVRERLNAPGRPYGDAVLLAWAALAALCLALWRARGPWRRRYLELTTPLYHAMAAARARLAHDPDDPAAHAELGRIRLLLGDAAAARAHLARAVARQDDAPALRFLAGAAALEAADPAAACREFEAAGRLLAAPDADPARDLLFFEAMLGLARARQATGDLDGALDAARDAHERIPGDVRAILLGADLLVATKRRDEAAAMLEAALERAHNDMETYELRKRLEDLPGAAGR